MPTKTNAYVKDGRLIILGVTATTVGAIPFSFDCPVPDGIEEGPLDIGAENESLKETLSYAHGEIKKQVSQKRLRVEAEHLVLRARNGDQNAMAMLIGIRDSAQAGAPVARHALAVIQRFIENHPVEDDRTEFGSETERETAIALKQHVATDDPIHYCMAVLTLLPYADSDKAITLIANGPLVDKPLVELVTSGLEDDEKEQFENGFTGKVRPVSDAARLGRVFRKARQLQAGRHGRLDLFCPMVAWELGL